MFDLQLSNIIAGLSYHCTYTIESFGLTAHLQRKLCLFKITKSDVCIRLFSQIHLIPKLLNMLNIKMVPCVLRKISIISNVSWYAPNNTSSFGDGHTYHWQHVLSHLLAYQALKVFHQWVESIQFYKYDSLLPYYKTHKHYYYHLPFHPGLRWTLGK